MSFDVQCWSPAYITNTWFSLLSHTDLFYKYKWNAYSLLKNIKIRIEKKIACVSLAAGVLLESVCKIELVDSEPQIWN